jgi:hypothetical protein
MKNMFDLLKDLQEAQDLATNHYWSCEHCQKYWNHIDVPLDQEYLKLKSNIERIRREIKNHKIDIS